MTEVPLFTTGLSEETHQFVWKIKNHHSAITLKDTLERNAFDLNLTCKSGTVLTFRCGYKKKPDSKFCMFLRLTHPPEDHLTMFVKWKIERSTTGDGTEWKPFTNSSDTPVKLEPEKDLEFCYFCFSQNLTGFEDAAGHMWYRMTLVLVYPEQTVGGCMDDAITEFKKLSVSKLQSDLIGLQKMTKPYGTVKLVCSDGVEVTAYGAILAARNPVFALELATDMKESHTGIIKLEDISSPTMKILLHYLYSANLPEHWNDPNTIVELTYAAGKYQLTELLNLLDNVLGKEDDETEASDIELLSLANKLGLRTAEKGLAQRIMKMVNSADHQ